MPEGVWKRGERRKDTEAGASASASNNVEKNRMYQGTIKCFDDTKGYGFIKSLEVFEQYQSDVFMHHKQFNGGLYVGDYVQFRVQVNARGKPQAIDVDKCDPSTQSVADALEQHVASSRDRADVFGGAAYTDDGLRGLDVEDAAPVFEGTVKLIDAAKGYGFIRCEESYALYGRDVFAAQGLLEGLRAGDPVRFLLRPGKDGRPQAAELCLNDPCAPPQELFGGHAGGALLHRGAVKRIDAERGYGFVACQELFEIYGSDVFASPQQLGGFAVGDPVSFAVKLNRRGQPQAVGLAACAPEAGAEAGAAEERMSGTIKSFDPERGYGFISSPEVHESYGRDVFLHARQIGGFQPGDRVAFSVRINGQGQPQASDLREAPRTVAWLAGGEEEAPAPEAQHEGEIKSFNGAHGYGFIECPALHRVYGRDVFIHQSQAEGLGVGDRITFRVQLKRGQPQACQVAPLDARERAAGAGPRPAGSGGDELDRKLLRACTSARPESLATLEELLAAGADPNGRDVTGHTALMAAALNARHGERKCRLLIEHRADIRALYSDRADSVSVLQWARERINARFAEFLEAVESGKDVDYAVALDIPRDID